MKKLSIDELIQRQEKAHCKLITMFWAQREKQKQQDKFLIGLLVFFLFLAISAYYFFSPLKSFLMSKAELIKLDYIQMNSTDKAVCITILAMLTLFTIVLIRAVWEVKKQPNK